jgi:hypothetical protein
MPSQNFRRQMLDLLQPRTDTFAHAVQREQRCSVKILSLNRWEQ